ncbi:MAG: MYXO-CTERM sorting domain-containing protein [Myxococcales bacterium]
MPDCPESGCGDDHCGGVCATCAEGSRCRTDRSCAVCTPSCGDRKCGPDHCGGSCGACANGTWCDGLETCKESGHCESGASRCWQAPKCGSLACDEAAKTCQPTVTDSKSCLIDLACYATAEANPANVCQKCDSARPTEWSAASGACDDGDACTAGDTCQSGRCVGTTKDCSAQAGRCKSATCDPVSGACVTTVLADGTSCDDQDACTTGDTCRAGVCEAGTRTCSSGCGCAASGAAPAGSWGLALVAVLLGKRRWRRR